MQTIGKIGAARALLTSREVSCEELTRQYLDAIHKDNEALNAYVNVTDDAALDTARQVDAKLRAGEELRPLEGIPMTLVVDGRVQAEHLKKCGLTAGWLLNRLRPLGYERAESVLLASLDTQGRLFVQGKGEQGKMHLVQALEKKAAGW